MINVKNSSLEYFENYKSKYKAKRYHEDCNNFELRENIRDDLMTKQRTQCAYCESRIEKYNSHIEHIEPRDISHTLECEYSNLILSCDNNDSCGIYKDSKPWVDSFIHPVLQNPTEFFYYSSNGEILAIKQNNNANKTIDFLNLNSRKLTSIRKQIIYNLEVMNEIGNISQYFNEFENLVKNYK